MSRILVTGGCGFIGANLCEYLLSKEGYELCVIDDFFTGRKDYLDEVVERTGKPVDLSTGKKNVAPRARSSSGFWERVWGIWESEGSGPSGTRRA